MSWAASILDNRAYIKIPCNYCRVGWPFWFATGSRLMLAYEIQI
ncbi:hypothetical protein X975_24252, partial [Stegodyphus mimosarum]